MALHQVGGLRNFEFKDLIKGSTDFEGCVLVVGIGSLAGCAAGTVGADKLHAVTKGARLLVGGSIGGVVGALVAAGWSNGQPRWAMIAGLLGGCIGAFGASTLALPPEKGGKGADKEESGLKKADKAEKSAKGDKDSQKDIEVRAHGYERFVAKAPAAFQYYEPVRFGKCGRNIELQDAPQGPGIIARRKDGLLHGVALTAAPLLDCDKKGPQYYFEVDVREPTQTSKTRTLFLGFAWPARQATETTAADFGTLPEVSSEMGRSIVIGGDLPKVFVDGKGIAKARGWRPLKDVGPGSLVGVLLALANAAENK